MVASTKEDTLLIAEGKGIWVLTCENRENALYAKGVHALCPPVAFSDRHGSSPTPTSRRPALPNPAMIDYTYLPALTHGKCPFKGRYVYYKNGLFNYHHIRNWFQWSAQHLTTPTTKTIAHD